MKAKDLYNATRQMGKAASTMRDTELMAEAMQTGDFSKIFKREVRKQQRKLANKFIRNIIK